MAIIPTTPENFSDINGVTKNLTNQITKNIKGMSNLSEHYKTATEMAVSQLDGELITGAITTAHLTNVRDTVMSLKETVTQQATSGFALAPGISPNAIGDSIKEKLETAISSIVPSGALSAVGDVVSGAEAAVSSIMASVSAPFNVLKGIAGMIPMINLSTITNMIIAASLPTTPIQAAAQILSSVKAQVSVNNKVTATLAFVTQIKPPNLMSIGDAVKGSFDKLNISSVTGNMDVSNFTTAMSFSFPPGVKDIMDQGLRGIADVKKLADNIADLPSMGGRGIQNLIGNTPNMTTNAILAQSSDAVTASGVIAQTDATTPITVVDIGLDRVNKLLDETQGIRPEALETLLAKLRAQTGFTTEESSRAALGLANLFASQPTAQQLSQSPEVAALVAKGREYQQAIMGDPEAIRMLEASRNAATEQAKVEHTETAIAATQPGTGEIARAAEALRPALVAQGIILPEVTAIQQFLATNPTNEQLIQSPALHNLLASETAFRQATRGSEVALSALNSARGGKPFLDEELAGGFIGHLQQSGMTLKDIFNATGA